MVHLDWCGSHNQSLALAGTCSIVALSYWISRFHCNILLESWLFMNSRFLWSVCIVKCSPPTRSSRRRTTLNGVCLLLNRWPPCLWTMEYAPKKRIGFSTAPGFDVGKGARHLRSPKSQCTKWFVGSNQQSTDSSTRTQELSVVRTPHEPR